MTQCPYILLKAEIEVTLHYRDRHAYQLHVSRYPAFFSPAQGTWTVWTLIETASPSKQDGSFRYDRHGRIVFKVANAKDDFSGSLCRRLERITVENDDALKVIQLYDSLGAFPQSFKPLRPLCLRIG